MFRLEDPGERAGEVTITCSIFDLLSAETGFTYAISHMKHIIDELPEESAWRPSMEAHMKDAEANRKEMRRIIDDREEKLIERERDEQAAAHSAH